MNRAALGFRVKSGYAIGVALSGPASAPVLLARRIVELSDPAVPETRQPYHDGLARRSPQAKAGFYKQQDDPQELARRIRIVERCAKRSIAWLLKDDCLAGLRCRNAGLVVGSVIDPSRVGNLHIRAHASEGQLFRTVLADALLAHEIHCEVVVEKALPARAVKELRRTPAEIARTVAALGRTVGGPWRAEEKAACVAAWLML
jgi:hypothetical protein